MNYAQCTRTTTEYISGGGQGETTVTVFASAIFPANYPSGQITLPTAAEVYNADSGYASYDHSSLSLQSVIDTTTGQSVTVNNYTFTGKETTYKATYNFIAYAGYADIFGTLEYIFSVFQNRLPLKKWTITDVIVRACDLIEPLKYGQKPRFRLDGVIYDDTTGNATGYQAGSIAERLDKIIAPEYAFTKMTFREQMQQVGGYIHGEFRITRITPKSDTDRRYFTFTFDKYGGNKKAVIKDLKTPISATFKTDINEYCTSLDSSAENIINQLDWAQGVIIEPFKGQSISLRSENTTARMEENNDTIIPTTYPLYQTGSKTFKLICTRYDNTTGEWDITPYVFEKADYDLLLSYNGTYPYCKAYALYYTQSERNIKGLFFKNENAISQWFERYAIVNILRAVTGNYGLNIDDYTSLCFRIEYKPIYSERVRTNKACVVSGLPRTLAYNQSANLIEARHYGENLKGIVARLGNVEKTLTYLLGWISDIPKVGTLFDEHYYISAVYTEFLQPYIKCTIALSKDFNRLSQYIGINSEKRMWEVSEKMAQKRETVINEYLMISENPQESDEHRIFQMNPLNELFNKSSSGIVTATCVDRRKKDLTLATTNDVTLSTVAATMGNSMLFTFKFDDNYSAGQKAIWYTTSGNKPDGNPKVSGRYGNYVPYSDYYGRFYWLGFIMRAGNITDTDPFDIPNVYARGQIVVNNTLSHNWIKYRKDSREVPQISYILSAVTDNEDYVIGSELMRNSGLVNLEPKGFMLYAFKERLNTIDGKIAFDEMGDYTLLDINQLVWQTSDYIFNPYIDFSAVSLPENYSSWAIVTEITATNLNVEDEDGNQITQTVYSGGEVIIGKNGAMPEKLYFTVKSTLYD